MKYVIISRKPVNVVSVEFVKSFDYNNPTHPFLPAQLQWQYNQYIKYREMSAEQYSLDVLGSKFCQREWVDFELGRLVNSCRNWNFLITDKNLVYGL